MEPAPYRDKRVVGGDVFCELTLLFNAVGSTVDKLIVVSCPDLGVASNVFTTKGTATAQSLTTC
jgi:hypothetical protein